MRRPRAAATGRGSRSARATRPALDLVAKPPEIGAIDRDKLPPGLRSMTKPELATELDRRAKIRAEAQRELGQLAKQRAEYLRDHAAAGSGAAFDSAVKAT